MHRIEDRSISLTDANLYGIVIGVVLFVLGYLPYVLRFGLTGAWLAFDALFGNLLIFFGSFAVGIVLHEGLHGIGWGLLGGLGMDKIRYGIKKATPYAHATVPMSARSYRIGTMLPGLVLGLLPVILGPILAQPLLTSFGALMLAAASGDLLILWLLRDLPPTVPVEDHPDAAGARVLWPPASTIES